MSMIRSIKTVNVSLKSFPCIRHARLSTTSNASPDLKGIEHRWAKMKEGDQLDVLDYLNERLAQPWQDLTRDEQRALYYIYIGEWGPRSPKPQRTFAALVLGGLFAGLTSVALGVGLTNYAVDIEKDEKLKELETKLVQLQEKELALEQRQNRGWWFWK